jgi:hypothetical protein
MQCYIQNTFGHPDSSINRRESNTHIFHRPLINRKMKGLRACVDDTDWNVTNGKSFLLVFAPHQQADNEMICCAK